jgi:hypothetical protein
MDSTQETTVATTAKKGKLATSDSGKHWKARGGTTKDLRKELNMWKKTAHEWEKIAVARGTELETKEEQLQEVKADKTALALELDRLQATQGMMETWQPKEEDRFGSNDGDGADFQGTIPPGPPFGDYFSHGQEQDQQPSFPPHAYGNQGMLGGGSNPPWEQQQREPFSQPRTWVGPSFTHQHPLLAPEEHYCQSLQQYPPPPPPPTQQLPPMPPPPPMWQYPSAPPTFQRYQQPPLPLPQYQRPPTPVPQYQQASPAFQQYQSVPPRPHYQQAPLLLQQYQSVSPPWPRGGWTPPPLAQYEQSSFAPSVTPTEMVSMVATSASIPAYAPSQGSVLAPVSTTELVE